MALAVDPVTFWRFVAAVALTLSLLIELARPR